MRMTPEEANGALTPYEYADIEDDPAAVRVDGRRPFSTEGLYLDRREDTIRVPCLLFHRPEKRD
jgi:hypothetical protein